MAEAGKRLRKIFGLTGGILLVLIAFWVRKSTRAPYVLLHSTESLALLPPLWLLGVLWFGMYFLLGCAAGQMCAMSALPPPVDVQRFRGGLYFLLLLICSFLWYIWLFDKAAFFWSWLLCGLSVLFSLACGYHWFRVSRRCGLMLWVITAGIFFLWLFQLMLMLHL